MMELSFVDPLWLWALAPVLILGLAALGRGRRRAYLFPALDFFPPPAPVPSAGRQAMDWLWLFVFAGAVLVVLAAAGPQVQWAKPPPQPTIRLYAVARALPLPAPFSTGRRPFAPRSPAPGGNAPSRMTRRSPSRSTRGNYAVRPQALSGEEADLWVRCLSRLPWRQYRLVFQSGGKTLALTVPTRRLTGGFTWTHLTAGRIVRLRLQHGHHMLAQTVLLRRSVATPFNINLVGHVPRALVRLLRLMPGAHWNQTGPRPTLTVLTRNGSAPWILRSDVILAIGRTAAPDLIPGGIIQPPPGEALTISQPVSPLLRHVHFASVHVRRLFAARLGPKWRTLVSLGPRPWLAECTDVHTHARWLWLASPPQARFTDWPQHLGFVIFFANLVRAVVGGPGRAVAGTWWRQGESESQRDSGSLWLGTSEHGNTRSTVATSTSGWHLLAPWLGLLSAALWTVVAAGLLWRYTPAGLR